MSREAPRDTGPTQEELEELFRIKYGDLSRVGWAPRLRRRWNYFTPDDHYEALVNKLVTRDTVWLDAGCGRFLFPSNPRLAETLARRCAHLTGVDPDATLEENPYVHEKARVLLDDFATPRRYDLVTLRMVAEHIADPERAAESLARLVRSGGRVVVYTVYKWAPIPFLTHLIPFRLHHPVKRVLWGTEEKDTFPVANRMNTRGTLRRLFEARGFDETWFAYLDDCRTLGGFRPTAWLELALWRCLRALRLHYLDVCICGVYRKR